MSMDLLRLLQYLLDPRTGASPALDRWKAVLLVLLLTVLGLLDYFDLYAVPALVYEALVAALAAGLLFDMGHYVGHKDGTGKPPE